MKDILFKLPGIYETASQLYNNLISEEGSMESETDEFEIIEGTENQQNRIAFGDNIRYMKYLLDNGYGGKFDMIYVDPPFFSKADYSIEIKVGIGKRKLVLAKKTAFSDRWEDGLPGYLIQMTESLMLMRDLLSDKGSIFIHLDWHSTHYIKILMDEIFGEKNFINEIIWNYKSGGVSHRYFARKHDNILFYSKTKDYFFKVQKEKSYNREYKPYRFKGVKEYKDEIGWYTLVNMKDVWQIDMVGRTSSERTGYATQKPEALIKRIINSVTSEGDLCGDFFCGSGTLGAVCTETNRNYIMCDIGVSAAMLAHKRMVMAGSPHSLLSIKTTISDNFEAIVSVFEIMETFEGICVSIDGLKYNDIEQIGVSDENRELFNSVLENHYSQLIEYWCADINYDGNTFRPHNYFCKEKDDVDLAVVFPKNEVGKIAVKIVDIFGNTYFGNPEN